MIAAVKPRRARPISYARDLWARREFTWFLALGRMKAQNASTVLGLVWWIVNPLLLGMIYLLVFGVVLQSARAQPDYLGYLLSGIFAFYYTRQAVNGAASSLLTSARMIANLRFPRLVLPLASLVEAAAGFLASLLVLILTVGLYGGHWPNAQFLLLVPAFLLQTMFNLGISGVVARLALPFRDLHNLVPYLMRLWLYLSPIIWPLSMLENAPEWAQQVLTANPMFSILGLYRMAFLGWPFELQTLLTAAAWSVGSVLVGVWVFVRAEDKMARYL